MSKYSKDIKLKAVRQYLHSNNSVKSIATRLGIHHSIVDKWVHYYQQHGAKAFDKKYSHYDASFKLSVLKYMGLHGESFRQVAAVFDIRDHGSIAKWENQYQTGGFQALKPKRKGCSPMSRKKPTKKADSSLSREELLKELEYLRAENAFLKKYDAILQEEEAVQSKKLTPSKD